VRGILEVLASTREYVWMRRMHATGADCDEWLQTRVPAEYQSEVRRVLAAYEDAVLARGLFGRGLLGAVDIAAQAGEREVFLVEDEWPWFRVAQMEVGIQRQDLTALRHLHESSVRALQCFLDHDALVGPESGWGPIGSADAGAAEEPAGAATATGADSPESVNDDGGSESTLVSFVAPHLEQHMRVFRRGVSLELDVLRRAEGGERVMILNSILEEIILTEYEDGFMFRPPRFDLDEMLHFVASAALTRLHVAVARGEVARRPEEIGNKLATTLENMSSALERRAKREQDEQLLEQARVLREQISHIRHLFSTEAWSEIPIGPAVLWET
jgi:hypothetical protein